VFSREEGEALHQETSVIEEVIGVIGGVRTSLLLWDSVLSRVAITDREFDDDMPNKLQQTIDKALASVQALQIPITPKMHAVKSHLAEQFKYFKGLKNYREEWVDMLHQVGIKDNKRSSGLRDRNKKFASHSKREEMSKHFEVKKAIADVNNQTKRNLKQTEKEKKKKKKEERQFKRKRDRQEYEEKFDTNDLRNYPSALDINLERHKRQRVTNQNHPNEHNNE
jgi:hypothetical protein